MDALDPRRLRFRPLAAADLPLMHRWLNTPHVLEWWEEPLTIEEVRAKYAPRILAEEHTRCFIISYGEHPIGMIQTYRIGDSPDYACHIPADPDAAGIDLFIGEEAYVHRGLGGPLLRRFLDEIVFAERVPVALIGPAVSNRSAIRAYEKAGFRYLATVDIPDENEPEYIMLARREDVAGR